MNLLTSMASEYQFQGITALIGIMAVLGVAIWSYVFICDHITKKREYKAFKAIREQLELERESDELLRFFLNER